MNEMPFIPEFREAKERNLWIKENADYFTVTRRRRSSYLREEKPSLEEAIAFANRLVERDSEFRCLIYAVYNIHDTLVATVSKDGAKYHE